MKLYIEKIVIESTVDEAIEFLSKMEKIRAGKLGKDFGVMVDTYSTGKGRLFYEIFKALAGKDNQEVDEKRFIEELILTKRFTDESAKSMITDAVRIGELTVPKEGYLWRAKHQQ